MTMDDSAIHVTRPRPGEFAAGLAGYIARAPEVSDAAGQLQMQCDALVAFLAPLSNEQSEYRYGPDKWSIKELLGHLCDSERIFAYRLLRIGRGDETPLSGFDENTYATTAQTGHRGFADVLEEWIAVRSATQALVRGLPADAWPRRGVSNGHPITAAALLYIILGHVDHHRTILEERYGVGRSE